MRYAQKYKDFGDFGYFTLLFVTFGEERVQHIRAQMRDLSEELALQRHFSASTKFAHVKSRFCGRKQ
jgi:hypothetical protein